MVVQPHKRKAVSWSLRVLSRCPCKTITLGQWIPPNCSGVNASVDDCLSLFVIFSYFKLLPLFKMEEQLGRLYTIFNTDGICG